MAYDQVWGGGVDGVRFGWRQAKRRSVAGTLVAAVLAVGGVTQSASADARVFMFTYEATTMPAGGLEYEQWVTWKTDKPEDHSFDRLDFRHEIEYGVTDHWQVALYVSDWRYEDGRTSSLHGSEWKGVAFETIYNLTSPVTDPLGIGLYGEIKVGDESLELEGKLLLQKNVGPFIFAWNGIVEAEWEDNGSEKKGVFEQTAGISYQIIPAISAGAELVHEVEFENWSSTGEHILHAGPNFVYRGKGWWAGVAPLFQLTNISGEPKFITRLMIGIDF